SSAPRASTAPALVPLMSERKPPRKKRPGAMPSRRIAAIRLASGPTPTTMENSLGGRARALGNGSASELTLPPDLSTGREISSGTGPCNRCRVAPFSQQSTLCTVGAVDFHHPKHDFGPRFHAVHQQKESLPFVVQ